MDFDSYFAGISPGGLTDIYDIKILICYLLHSVNEPLTEDEVNRIFQERPVVNYFVFREAMESLKQDGHITLEEVDGRQVCKLEQRGIDTAVLLDNSLPRSLRDRVVEAALNLLTYRRESQEVLIDCKEVEDGFLVTCRLRDIGSDLMNLTLYAPDKLQAEQMQKNLREHSTEIYQGVMAAVTRNHELMKQSFPNEPDDEQAQQ